MAKGKNQKLKLFYLAKIMREETDDTHGLTMPEIIEKLDAYDIETQRKTVYEDIAILNDFGIEINKTKMRNRTYYSAGSRDFEIAELKFLVDAIQSSKFLTAKKTEELIKKFGSLVSNYDARILKRQVYVTGRVKNMDESIYYCIDEVHNAINSNKQISFQYFRWNANKEKVLKHDGKVYMVSPWALCWNDENYYLIAYDEEAGIIKHFRVDKMINVTMLEQPRAGEEVFKGLNKATYTKERFGMYDGEEEVVALLCEADTANMIIDRFGTDVSIFDVTEKDFKARVDVAISEQFCSWIISLEGVKVIGPDRAVAMMKRIKDRLNEQY